MVRGCPKATIMTSARPALRKTLTLLMHFVSSIWIAFQLGLCWVKGSMCKNNNFQFSHFSFFPFTRFTLNSILGMKTLNKIT